VKRKTSFTLFLCFRTQRLNGLPSIVGATATGVRFGIWLVL